MTASNNNQISNEERFISQLSFNNLIMALNQHDTSELKDLIQSPERLYFILLYLGIPQDILFTPAYRQLLEDFFCQALNTIIESQFAIADITNHSPNIFRIEIGSPLFVTDRFSFSIKDDMYIIHQHKSRNGNRIHFNKDITINTSKKIITIQETSSESIPDPMDFQKNRLVSSSTETMIRLDSKGFADATFQYKNNELNLTLKKDDLFIQVIQADNKQADNKQADNKKIPWNGSPLYLNSKRMDYQTLINNISNTIRRCPDSKDYYISVFGEEIINKIVLPKGQR